MRNYFRQTMNRLFFLKNFLEDKDVASVTPSSKFSVRKICTKINFNKKNIIVEYGPGTGVFSEYLLKSMSPDSKLVLIETNKYFVEELRKIKDERVLVFHDNAENVAQILHQCNINKVDYVISGIPFSFFNENLKRKIIENTYNSLSDGGKLLIYQFSHNIKKYLQQYFKDIYSELDILNIPPLCIFEVIKNG